MTAIEVFKEITSEPKWYVGFTSPQNASNIKKRFEEKKLEFSTLEKMFNHFGYFSNCKSPWIKGKPCEHLFNAVPEKAGSQNFIIECTRCGFKP